MTTGLVLDPTSVREDDNACAGPDAGLLTGKHVGFRVDNIWRAWDLISEQWGKRFEAAGAKVSFWRCYGRSGVEGDRMDRELRAWLEGLDVAVVGLANCGSCTGWTIRDAITAAEFGLPTTVIATRNFEAFAHTMAKRGGRSGLRVQTLPYPLNELAEEEVLAIGEAHFPALLRTMGAHLTDVSRAA